MVIESLIVKNKNQELFFIKAKQFNILENYKMKKSCRNYNTLKYVIIQKRKYSDISLIANSKPKLNQNKLSFFIALMKAKIEISCKINKSLEIDNLVGYNCINSDSNNIRSSLNLMIIETDSISDIRGIDKLNSENILNKTNIDFSDINNLRKINSYALVNIEDINGDTCELNGQYIIYGKISKNINITNIKKVEILLSYPESTSLCEVKIDGENITMICENREDFQISQIFIDKSLIYNSEGNIIFIINDYTSLDQFACDISLNSAEIENNTDMIEPEEEETDEPVEPNKKNKFTF